MPENSSLTFLPWLKSGLSSISNLESGSKRRAVEVSLKLVDETSQELHSSSQFFTLKAPADVIGFNPSIVARTEPANGESDFEYTRLAYAELTEPSFPWLYSLHNEGGGKPIPWIFLMVLKRDEFEVGPNNNVKLPTILLKKEKVPDLSQAWAWAHVQVAGNVPEDQENVEDYIKEHPELLCSRLIGPRLLDPSTLYSAFIVPTYEVGRLAGIGQLNMNSITPEEAIKLWDQKMNDESREEAELPVYYRFDFQTNEWGDIERLFDMLKFCPVPEGVGTRQIDGSEPGFLCDLNGNEKTYPNDTFYLEGALVPPGYNANRTRIMPTGFTQDILPELNRALEEAPIHEDEDIDPLVSIPVYGRYFQRTEKIEPPNAYGIWDISDSWIHEQNLDRRYRVASSIGTSVVQQNQEEYLDECWDQLGAIKEANEFLRLAGVGKLLNESLKGRRIDPLSDARFVLTTQPFHHYYIHDNDEDQRSFKARFKHSGLPCGIVSYTFKRILSQKIGFERENLFGPWKLASKNEGASRKALRVLLYFLRLIVKLLIAIFSKNPKLQPFVPFLITILHCLKIPAPNEKPRLPDRDNTFQKSFQDEFNTTLDLPDIYPLKSEIIPVSPIDIKQSFRPRFDIKTDLLERLNTTITVPWKGRLTSFNPILKCFKINLPMYRPLSERSVDLMVPGLGKLENNIVVLMEENRKFIHTIMESSNDAIVKEFVWREVPVAQGCTVFKYFWDPQRSENAPPDILDIHEWGGELGTNIPPERENTENSLVLAIKADLIRRYPNTIIFAIKKKDSKSWNALFDKIDNDDESGVDGIEHLENGQSRARDNSFLVYPPIYSANVGPDVVFLGFPFSLEDIERDKQNNYEYFFIFMEHPSVASSFGFDEKIGTTPNTTLTSKDDLNREHVKINSAGWIDAESLKAIVNVNILGAPSWGDNSAAMAWFTFQKPVRIVVPSDKLLKQQE